MSNFDYMEEIWQRDGLNAPWINGSVEPELVNYLEEYEPERALDLGCGHGEDSAYMDRIGIQVDAIDVSPTAIELATAKWPDINFIVGDVLTYDFQDEYDFVYDRAFLGLCEDKAAYIDKVESVLATDGRWMSLIGRDTGDDFKGPPRYKRDEVEQWFSNSFNILSVFESSTTTNQGEIPLWCVIVEKNG